MITCRCIYDNDYRTFEAYELDEFKWSELKAKQKGKSRYISIPVTFDIETSTISKGYNDKEQKVYESYPYIFQFCIEGVVLFVRTYEQMQEVFSRLKDTYELTTKRKLVVYVHNLSFEWQFIHQFFSKQEVFAMDKRKVLKCTFDDVFEFRCSYMLTNMNLSKFISNTPEAHFKKGVGDLDYKKIYTPVDELTDVEYGYCFNDVMGLYEAIMFRLKSNTLTTIPLTSTGYVRKDCRYHMNNRHNRHSFEKSKMNLDTYLLCKDCFRGGNTSSNRYHTTHILNNVSSKDEASAYPSVMIMFRYPTGTPMFADIDTREELEMYNNTYCTMARYIFTNIRVKEKVPIPYIPFSKCIKAINHKHYNGRILEADKIVIGLTNVDFEIIEKQYDYEYVQVMDFTFWRAEYLPEELTECIQKYYYNKTTLKGVDGKEYEYALNKAQLNSIYGMCVTDILRDNYSFNDDNQEWEVTHNTDLDKYYNSRNNFLQYQWGVFVTAYARKWLQDGIDIVGMDCVYCDTDSVKYLNGYKYEQAFIELNQKRIDEAELKHKKLYCDFNGKRYYLGIFDDEPTYDRFITMGAKKYAYEIDGKIGVTTSGLGKKQGAEELTKMGGLEYYKEGTTFYNSGRTIAKYNVDDIHTLVVNGVEITNASSISIIDTTYTLGITNTMKEILETLGIINIYLD